jgi:hypothetical protein
VATEWQGVSIRVGKKKENNTSSVTTWRKINIGHICHIYMSAAVSRFDRRTILVDGNGWGD